MEIKLHRNVKVIFGDFDDIYARAELMYRVKGFIFYKWIKVCDLFIDNCRYGNYGKRIENVPMEAVRRLKESRYYKKQRNNENEKMKRQIKQINKV